MKTSRDEIERAEELSAAIDQLIHRPGVEPPRLDPVDAGAYGAAQHLAAAVGRLGPPAPAAERRVTAAAHGTGRRVSRAAAWLRPAWAIGGLVVFLLALTLLTPVGHDALASFMAVFHLGRTEITITPASATATVAARSTAVQQELTLEQARAQVHFAIPEPAYLPDGYRLRGAISYTYPDLPAWAPQPLVVELVYEDGDGHSIQMRLYPILLGDRATISRLNLEAAPIREVRDVDVSGRPGVLLQLGPDGGAATWQEIVWEQGDLILALSSADLGEEELLRMARSVR